MGAGCSLVSIFVAPVLLSLIIVVPALTVLELQKKFGWNKHEEHKLALVAGAMGFILFSNGAATPIFTFILRPLGCS